MFRPQIRGSLLDALERLAEQSGREPNELLEELLVQATSTDAPSAPATAPTPSPPAGQAPTLNARKQRVPIGETMDAAKRRRAGEDPVKPPSDESDEAPPQRSKGDRPNPLKAWAGSPTKDDPATKESKALTERPRLQSKYLRPNRVQRR